jgi:hypothetical protein
MNRVLASIWSRWLLLGLLSLCSVTFAAQTPAVDKGKKAAATPQQQLTTLQRELQQQAIRLGQLEEANRVALTRNQALQLENDNLKVQVKVLQSERSAQMFLYGAATLGAGALIGYLFANHLSRRSRRW